MGASNGEGAADTASAGPANWTMREIEDLQLRWLSAADIYVTSAQLLVAISGGLRPSHHLGMAARPPADGHNRGRQPSESIPGVSPATND
eukprot:scaffold495241_cov16-Prasinocladus_malaysianus.AAC.1